MDISMVNPLHLITYMRPSEFFSGLDAKWVEDLQNFVRAVLPKLIVTLIGAWILIRVLKAVTHRVLLLAESRTKTTGQAGHIAQVRTLTSVIRATGIGVIGFLTALEVLPLLGFKLEPLLASAGVVGVALGLAAQTIVKDCLNGILILIEDQYNIGDVVSLAGQKGTVEVMSLRKTQVRDSDGTLYLIPNSQITTVANFTRDFSVATINVSVDFSAEPDKVLDLLKKVAMDVRTDPAYSDYYLADPTLLGVDAIKGSQVIYPVQLKTRANQQWVPMRETQRRIRMALAEHKMLPGDPLRVFASGGASGGAAAAGAIELPAAAKAAADPTAAKPNEINPFTGEGM